MEIKGNKIKLNFDGFSKKKSNDEFNPIELIEVSKDAMPIPEIMKKDRMKMLMNKNRKGVRE